MKELYHEYFRIPKDGKISEKAMLVRVAVTVIVVILCLAAMGISAYAYFSSDVTSASNVIKSARFDVALNIEITDENGNVVPVSLLREGKDFVASLSGKKTYTVTIRPAAENTAKTGFVIVTVVGSTNTDKYHTGQLGKDGDRNVDEISFKMTLSKDAVCRFTPHWGTSSYYGATDDSYISGDVVELNVDGVPLKKLDAEGIYTVVAGDTLSEIASYFEVSLNRLIAYNENITAETVLHAGQKIKIPTIGWQPEQSEPEANDQPEEEPSAQEPEQSEQSEPEADSSQASNTETDNPDEDKNETSSDKGDEATQVE